MSPFACIGQFPIFPGKIHTISDQISDNLSGASDHNIHRLFPVLIMPRPHRIFKITVVVIIVAQYTDSALRKERITALQICLRNHDDLFLFRKIERCEQTSDSGSYDHYIRFHFHLRILRLFRQLQHSFQRSSRFLAKFIGDMHRISPGFQDMKNFF